MHPRAERPTPIDQAQVRAALTCQRCGYFSERRAATIEAAWINVAFDLAEHDCQPRYLYAPRSSDWRTAWHALRQAAAELAPWLVVAAVVFVIVCQVAVKW